MAWFVIKCTLVVLLMTVSEVTGRALSDIGNPVVPNSNCGRSKSSFVCDPDGLLTAEEGDALDKDINDIQHHTPCPCTPQQCAEDPSGYRIGIALVQKMQVDSVVHGLNKDLSGENLLAQQLRAKLAAAKNYASSLLTSWAFGRCGEAMLVFCSKEDAMCYTVADTIASKKLSSDIIGEIASMHVSFNLTERLIKMIHNYKLVFLDSYNRTTNWQSSGSEPEVARVVLSSQNSVHVPAQCLIALLVLFVVSFVAGSRALCLHH